MILNRRMLLATLGLSLSAVSAEAATRKKTAKTPKKPTSTHRVASHKPRKPAAAKPQAQG